MRIKRSSLEIQKNPTFWYWRMMTAALTKTRWYQAPVMTRILTIRTKIQFNKKGMMTMTNTGNKKLWMLWPQRWPLQRICSMQDNPEISSWILLQSRSTLEIISNENLLTNIHDKKHALILHYNAGTATMNKNGDLKCYGIVWYHPNGIANILSLYNVQSRIVLEEKASFFYTKNTARNMYLWHRRSPFFSNVRNDVVQILVNMVGNTKIYSKRVLWCCGPGRMYFISIENTQGNRIYLKTMMKTHMKEISVFCQVYMKNKQ